MPMLEKCGSTDSLRAHEANKTEAGKFSQAVADQSLKERAGKPKSKSLLHIICCKQTICNYYWFKLAMAIC